MPFSFWEQNTFIKSPDVVIIGSGIVGLNAAIALKKLSASLHVIVLERGMLPYGASTRNAGFACFGSVSELLADMETQPENEVFSLVEKRWKGLQLLRSVVGDKHLLYEQLGGYEVFTEKDELLFEKCSASINYLNKNISSITGTATNYRLADEKIKLFGFNGVNHIIENISEGQVDTGQMMKALFRLALSTGIEILNGANVTDIVNEKDGVQIQIRNAADATLHLIKSRRVIICINGFAKKFLPTLDVNPARAQVLITSPVDNLKVNGSFHYDHGYYYFRNVGKRILIGGGRNLDFEGETTTDMNLTPLIQNKLERLLDEMVLPGLSYSVEMRWSGIMGLGAAKKPIVQMTAENIYCAVRMGGMGVAIGSLAGNDVAKLVYKSL